MFGRALRAGVDIGAIRIRTVGQAITIVVDAVGADFGLACSAGFCFGAFLIDAIGQPIAIVVDLVAALLTRGAVDA